MHNLTSLKRMLPFLNPEEKSTIAHRSIRFRTLGCYPQSGAVLSEANSVADILSELLQAKNSEREGRTLDKDQAGTMEKKKREGYFQDATFALLTLHGKEHVMAPVLWEQLGVKIQHTQAFNTDALGTFSGETERILTPIDCAKKKAALACELTGNTIGLGSEGSFSPGPIGLMTLNEELIACVNIAEHWTVVGRSYQPCSVREQLCQNPDELAAFLSQTPSDQGLILKAQENLSKGLYGDLAIHEQLQLWFGNEIRWPLTICYDLRAHHCPERRERIALATENLIQRLLSNCPHCELPGFWADEVCFGLPCLGCGTPTNAIKQRIAVCLSCQYRQVFPVDSEYADPYSCARCNP